MSGLKSTALHQWEYRMQGYTNGVSIFQRDFAVKQDYPEIIKPETIKVSKPMWHDATNVIRCFK